MTKNEFAERLKHASAAVIGAEAELTEIDSRFGDADHGLTMTKIAKAISAAAVMVQDTTYSRYSDGTVRNQAKTV